jgi:hypothetical protein
MQKCLRQEDQLESESQVRVYKGVELGRGAKRQQRGWNQWQVGGGNWSVCHCHLRICVSVWSKSVVTTALLSGTP